YPRSGTTLAQMLVCQLMGRGRVEFNHISEICPTLDDAKFLTGEWLTTRLLPRRVFKTHLQYRMIRRLPGKFIYVVRDGRDVLLSYYHFTNRLRTLPFSFDQ